MTILNVDPGGYRAPKARLNSASGRLPTPRISPEPASSTTMALGAGAPSSVRSTARCTVGSGCLELLRFDGGIELRARGMDKGQVIGKLLSEVAPDASVAYAGDDRTDEDAFRALGERGLRVLVRDEVRPTLADLWLRPPGELLDFLFRWLRTTGGSP